MEHFPTPGNGYTIREKLGTGNWKTAYRASSMHSAADVALLYFHDDSQHKAFTGEVINHLHTMRKHPYSHYVAEFKGIQADSDGHWYIVEELLARPLDRIGVVNDIVRLVRMARDLCRGLACLHAEKLVHRDIKLDNCGLDHRGQAKIFDLGLVTSDPKDIRGNIFTRAPELFDDHSLFGSVTPTLMTDVWALGATIFALRFGEYPFVHPGEIQERKNLNQLLKTGEISADDAEVRKEELRLRVTERIRRPKAFTSLRAQISKEISGRAADILTSMLSFEAVARPEAAVCADNWGKLARELGGISPSLAPDRDKWHEIAANLESVKRGDMLVTRKQIERLAAELHEERYRDRDNSELRSVESLIIEIKNDDILGIH